MRRLVFAAILLLLSGPALAQTSTFTDLPDGGALLGAEIFGADDAGVTSNFTADEIKAFVAIATDITTAATPATCNGVADDSNAFEAAVNAGGVYLIPNGATCLLSSTAGHSWTSNTTFICAHPETASIDIDAGANFDINAGADVGLYNCTIKNGGEFLTMDAGLAGTVNSIKVIGNVFDNVNSWCADFGTTSENALAVVTRFVCTYNDNINPPLTTSVGLRLHGGEWFDVDISHNYSDGGRRGIVMGFYANADNESEIEERRRFIISHNRIINIDGQGQGGGVTVACIYVQGQGIEIIGNTCSNVKDQGTDDTECIYAKGNAITIAFNYLFDCGFDEAMINVKGQSNAAVDPSVAPNCTDASVTQASECGWNVMVIGNTVHNTDSTLDQLSCLKVQSQHAWIQGNTFRGCGEMGIIHNSGGYIGTVIKDNQFYEFFCGQTEVIAVRDDMTGVVIEGNKFWGFSDADCGTIQLISVQEIGTGETFDGLVIRNNVFHVEASDGGGNTLVGIDVTTLAGGTLQDLYIDGNVFKGSWAGDTCVKVTNSGTITNMTLIGNKLQRCGTEYTRSGGVPGGDTLVSNNLVSGCTPAGCTQPVL